MYKIKEKLKGLKNECRHDFKIIKTDIKIISKPINIQEMRYDIGEYLIEYLKCIKCDKVFKKIYRIHNL